MKTKTKLIFAGVGVLGVGLCIWLLPRMAQRIDAMIRPGLENSAASEAQYQEMISLYPIAGELVADHPTHKRWKECKAALLKAGYIETREFPLGPAADKGATKAFFNAFQARFPGVECSVRAFNSPAPVFVVTARKRDLRLVGEITMFTTHYALKP